MKQFVLAITGPAGAGKTTTGQKVARYFEHCVDIDADSIKRMIVSGFYEDKTLPGGGGFDEWEILGDNIGLLASNFMKHGYDVIINGYIDPIAWHKIEGYVTITNKVLLLPELDTVIGRDAGRHADIMMGEPSVRAHHHTFSTDPFYDDFVKIDSTHQSVEETVEALVNIVSQKS